MDFRLRGNDKGKNKTERIKKKKEEKWIPACAGMTRKDKTEKETDTIERKREYENRN